MKYKYTKLITFIMLSLFSQRMIAGQQMWADTVNHTQVSLDSGIVVLGQINLNLPSSGKVEVHFTGHCISTPGDLIVLAASNIPDWDVNDGNLGTFALDSIVNSKSFSHTRVYNVTAGADTFYAVGQNYVCQNGPGTASVYGMLTVIFFPDSTDAILEHDGFDTTVTVDAGPTVLNSVTINPAVPGTAVVRFDGSCSPDYGDRIYLGASDDMTWAGSNTVSFVETFSTSVCENDITYANTQVYQIPAGSKTFYALGENYGETDGNGEIFITGSLTVEFYPDGGDVTVESAVIDTIAADLTNGPLALASFNLNTAAPGNMLLRFDGVCVSDTGDAIVLASGNSANWGTNYRNVTVMAQDTDINTNSFSHTMVYPVSASSFDCYAVGENYMHTNGSGLADIHGTLVAVYFRDMNTSVSDLNNSEMGVSVFPNPSSMSMNISIQNPITGILSIKVYDITGRVVKTFVNEKLNKGIQQFTWNTSEESKGVYFLRVESAGYSRTEKVVIN